ncbi:MAG: hypothetical protein QNJ98_19030 [Planctomycetota bacterium]|nr:hypothetical protein [Planctomycetota bacterium]
MRRIPLMSFLLLLALGSAPLFAGGPTAKRVEGHDGLARGTLEGLSLSDDGVLRPGPRFDAMPLEVPTAWAAVRHDDGTLWIGTGNRAALLRVAPDGTTTRIEMDDGFLITALAPLPGGAVAAAVFPGSRVVKVDVHGKTTALAELDCEYVWALAQDGDSLVAACGMPGSVHRITLDGETKRIAEIDDEHARALLVHRGTITVGTAPRGLVLRVDAKGVRVLRDLDEEEVVGLVHRADGSLLIAANKNSAGGNAQMLGMYLGQLTKPQPTKPGQTAPKRNALQDGRVYHLEASGVLTSLWSRPKVAVLTLASDGTGAVAGTYPSGRIVRVEPGSTPTLLTDLPEAEASVLVSDAQGLAAVVTSNPAVLHRLRNAPARGTYTSPVLDAGSPSAWGRVTLWTGGAKSARYRTGATNPPDASWSAWTRLGAFDGQTGKAQGTARFLQVKVELEGDDAFLRSVAAIAQAPNGRPAVSEVAVATPSANGTGAPKANPVRQITWKASDPDKDRLAVTITVKRQGAAHAVTLVDAEVLKAPKHAWDTSGMPDGLYEVSVRVADGPDNPADRARGAQARLAPVRVDNTAPTVTCRARVLEGGALRVEGRAADPAGGRIHSIRVAVNGGPWQPLGASDGLFDDDAEAFGADLPVPAATAYDVVVQALDAFGNRAATTTTVR